MRPVDSYQAIGQNAYLEGKSNGSDDSPYAKDSLAHLEWRHAWLDAYANDQFAFEPPEDHFDISEQDIAQDDANAAQAEVRRFLARALVHAPSVEDLEAHAGPASAWPLRCYEIATILFQSGLLQPLIDKYGPARVLYGAYEGYVSKQSPFAGRPISRHGWIEFENGFVVDPTRWVFEGIEPEIAIVSAAEYDFANRRMRRHVGIDDVQAPPFDETGRVVAIDINDPDVISLLDGLLGEHSRLMTGQLGLAQAFFIGKLPLETFGEHAGAIYRAFERAGLKAMVPIDHWNYVFESEAPAVAFGR